MPDRETIASPVVSKLVSAGLSIRLRDISLGGKLKGDL